MATAIHRTREGRGTLGVIEAGEAAATGSSVAVDTGA
jgi:hypothetical protein